MRMVSFNCPHCGDLLEAPEHMDGKTLGCPNCDRPVTLEVVSAKQMVGAAVLVGAASVLATIFGLGD